MKRANAYTKLEKKLSVQGNDLIVICVTTWTEFLQQHPKIRNPRVVFYEK